MRINTKKKNCKMSLIKRFNGVRKELGYIINNILIFSRFTDIGRGALSLQNHENMRMEAG
jgi:hypothetical protein